MPRLNVSVTNRLESLLDARIREFTDAERAARIQAARTATAVSQREFKYRRDIAPPRAGRSSTGGKMASFVQWRAVGAEGGPGGVSLNVKQLDSKAPHWIIQEIGTGKRATLKSGGQANPVGRPAAGATYVRTVRSQRGRRLKGGFVFATPGGQYSPPGSARGQQIYLASQITGVPHRAPSIVIQREIKGQHFIKKGGQEGFRQYKSSTLAAARRAFRKRGGR